MQTVLAPALRFEIKELIDERIREKHVTREDFTELKEIVKEIAQELKELAREQKETKKELKELARAQGRTELRVEELTLALKDTKSELKDELKYTRRDLGGITSTLGFMLENEVYRILPKIFEDRYGIEVRERFLRRSIRSFGVEEEGEVNIFSRGVRKDKGTEVVIIGESRSRLGKDDIDDLLDTAAKLKGIDKGGRFLLAVTHYAREPVIEYAKKKGVEVIQSFEW
ncbi:hypothetical protein KJ693_05970 [bacterium]|nr:hypothetical protein [bacterium]MBU1614846.1 hypothetical protein [bacterium]